MLEDLNFNIQLKISQSPFGKKLDEYKHSHLVGEGGFSKVYEAVCCKTGFTVAIKLIEKCIINYGLRDRILKEISIQSQLNHSSILKLHTAFEDANYVCLVLEYCSESDLKKYMDRENISEKDVKSIMKQIIAGLEYLHSKHILHRDIKLSNILLTEDKQIKIADFGLATFDTPGESHKTMCGTPNYISPEIVTRKEHGQESDVWSAGCLLYTLLVGKPPFQGDTPSETMQRIISGSYFVPPFLPHSAQDLINRLLQKDPNSRPTLNEVRNHPFISDDSIPYKKWTSSDSGVDTYSGSSNFLSPKHHSLKHEQSPSNYSYGYDLFETPKSTRRCRSQDRPLGDDPSRVLYHRTDVRISNEQSGSFKNKNLHRKEILKFSPIQSNTSDRDFQSCKMHCENEILKHEDCNCWKCKLNLGKNFEHLKLSPNLMNQKQVSSSKYQQLGHTSDLDSPDDRVKIVPFNTERLKPKREELRNVVFWILENGDVCIERLRSKSDTKSVNKEKKLVVEVVRISRNGSKMHIYYPNKGRGVPLDSQPPSMPSSGADAVFNCDTLSRENWKRYQKAAQFVDMVKAKTPKLTLYKNNTKCLLMENQPDPDFQIIYYTGKKKITKSRKGVIFEDNGKEWSLDNVGKSGTHKDPFLAEHYNFFVECYRQCQFIEEQLTSISSTCSKNELKLFPAILGKKSSQREENPVSDLYIDSPNMFHSTKHPT